SYFYKVIPINSCDKIQVKGNYSAKVILSANETDGITKLKWSKHKIWETGVEKYVVEKLNETGMWDVVKEVNANTFEIND
ncbi:MAG: hypothetical protein KJO64_05770, partial [Bacteroidia bacterium]|nr:hypothetical protein [Bacteroidia bacterium]